MMKYILIPDQKGYKANLHTHTTDSDGRLTPEEAVAHYKKHGYSILAITDHLYMRDRSSLNTEDFVVISGYENNIIDWHPEKGAKFTDNPLEVKCYHLLFYAPKPDQVGMVGVVKRYHDFFNKNKTQDDKDLCPILDGFYPEEYSKALAQQAIDAGLDEGYLVAYTHPRWSNQDQDDFLGLKGLFAMEMVNGGSLLQGYAEDNQYVYDLMLRDGQKICCFANDDNHNLDPNNDDSFVGFNIIFCEELTYESVFQAMRYGNLYASTGALFKEVYIENDVLHVTTVDDCRTIKMVTNGRYCLKKWRKDQPLHAAEFPLKDKNITYVRVVIENMRGEKAFTRAYFVNLDFYFIY